MSERGAVALVAVQLRVEMDALEGPVAYRRWLEGAAERAAAAAGDGAHRLFVFPEAIGHLAPLALAAPPVRQQESIAAAVARMAARRPLALLRGIADAGALSLKRAALLAVLPEGERLIRRIFAAVARRHRATVVAGSHLMAHTDGRVTNASFCFDPGGRLAATTHKVNLVPEIEDARGLGLARGDPDRLPVVSTPWGRIATLIGHDGAAAPFSPRERFAFMGARADARAVQVIANPLAAPWPRHAPELDTRPAGTEPPGAGPPGAGLPAAMAELGRVGFGVVASLCGWVLDVRFEGRSAVLARRGGGVEVLAQAAGPEESEIVAATVPAAALASAGA